MQDPAQIPTQRVNWNRIKHRKRRNNPPTKLEQRLYRALHRLHLNYREAVWFGHYEVDAYLPEYRLVIEADGCPYHGCPTCTYAPPPDLNPYNTPAYQAERDFVLRRIWRVSVLHIWSHDLSTDDQARETLRRLLPPMGIRI